jgi:D-sedoheptulose 7-phosphate isomerase
VSAPDQIGRFFDEHRRLVDAVSAELSGAIADVAGMVSEAVMEDRAVFFCGNGGSAADAQHMAAEYVVRFRRDRRPFRALALTTDSSVLTAAANDDGFASVFARQVRAWCRPGDVLFLHSTSGQSPNLLRAAEAAREVGTTTIALLARDGGPLRSRVDRAIVVPTQSTARAQEMHLLIGHIVCDIVEESIVSKASRPGPSDHTESAARAARGE